MFRDQIPLPAKIRESGEGYTLSGKPLDPNSAAAKPYLSRHHHPAGPKPVKKPDTPKQKKDEDDPMQGVELQQEQPKTEEVIMTEKEITVQTEKEITVQTEKEITVQTEGEKTDQEMDAITEAVETQTKELKIGDDDKKTMVSNLKEKKTTKSATPSPSNSSTYCILKYVYNARKKSNPYFIHIVQATHMTLKVERITLHLASEDNVIKCQ